MALDKLKQVRDELINIIANQKQVRTNKIKGLVRNLDTEIKEMEYQAENAPAPEQAPITPNTDPEKEIGKLDQILLSLSDEEREELFAKLDTEDLKKENKYLKRKVTMYELKIEKQKAEISKIKKEAKG